MKSATAESLGIPSKAISAFLQRILDHRLNLHSLLILRHGYLAAEGYWAPFKRDRKHRLYSISKSFTSLAVGLMIDRGLLSLDDKVIQFFPEKCPPNPHPWLAAATVRDMLMMADCHDFPTHKFEDPDWIATWFDTPPSHMPGQIFSYNTTCSNLLCAIVEKLAGMKFLEYMRPLFDVLGVSSDIYCIETPEAYSFGGSGVIATPRDLAKVALLCLNEGCYDGQQLISRDYIRQATARQIDNYIDHSAGENDIEHQQGYGYQIWRTRNNGFCFYGMGCQLAIGLPDKDLLIVTTGDTQGTSPDTSELMSALWETLYHEIKNEPLAEDMSAHKELEKQLAKLSLPVAEGKLSSPLLPSIKAKTYFMEENAMGIQQFRFDFHEDRVDMAYIKKDRKYEITFGLGYNIAGIFPEVYSAKRINTKRSTGYETHSSAAWRDDNTLLLICYITDDYFGSLKINASFSQDSLTVLMKKRAESFLDNYHGFASGTTIILPSHKRFL